MQVQASQTSTYTEYAQTILKAVSELEVKVNALYASKDKTNARSVIYSDYTVTVNNGDNLSVSFTYNSLPSVRKHNLRYTDLFLRVVLASNQNIYTLPDNNFATVKQVLNQNFGNKNYVHVTPTVTPSPILSNLDFIGERLVHIKNTSVDDLALAIEDLVTSSQAVQQTLNTALSVPRNPMPPNSSKSWPVVPGDLPIDNFELLGKIAWSRIGELKMVQSEFPAQFPVSYSVGVFNNTAGTLSEFPPACRVQYSGDKILLGTCWIFPCIPFQTEFFTQAYTVNFFSQFQNGASRLLPVANGNYAINFDVTIYGEPLSSAYGITAFNEVPVSSAEELAKATKEFYLSSRT